MVGRETRPVDAIASMVTELRYLYVGTEETEAAVAFYTGTLGATLRWRFRRFGADVAAVELGAGPLLLLADHRPAGTILPIWSVTSLADAAAALDAAGWTRSEELGTPEGLALALTDPAGTELALLDVTNPGALDTAWANHANEHRVES